jgi:putative transposase
VIPGQRSKVTRRCLERRMFLAPGERAAELANFVGYCLAVAAAEYGIEVHACVVMSNHHHTDVTDPLGKLPAFVQRFHSLIARGINTLRGRVGSFWDGEKPCMTTTPSDDQTLKDLVYTITNPVEAGLVKWSRLWRGFSTQGWRFGETRVFSRPSRFFDDAGEMPETAALKLMRPKIFAELDDDALCERLEQAVRQREQEIHAEFRGNNRRFLGAEKLARDRWDRAPTSYEERYKISPKVASSCKWLRMAQLQRNRDWEREYAAARELMLAGEAAVFPFGTWWLKHFVGVEVAERGPP